MKTINPSTNVDLPPIVPVSHSGNLPLSLTQTNLFLDQLEPNNAVYNIPIAYRLTGKLNVTALEESIRKIANRHESLRTTFTSINGEPQELIAPDINFNLPIIDLVELPETEIKIEVQNLIQSEFKSTFHLETDLLFRIKLLRIAREEHILLVTMHQIIFDDWSLGVFQEELTRLYQAFCTNQPSPFPELPIQYHDFALWQKKCLTSEILASQLDYWKKQLGGQLPVLDLPTDYPRPAIQTSSGKQQFLVLSPPLTAELKTLSQRAGVTLLMTILAAFQILLYRYSGQEDIIVGTLIPGRKPVETEGLIGLFANTLALRTNLAGNPSFRELLERVRQVALGADAHQDLPFEKLIEELQPERDLSRSRLFQVMFVLENTPQFTCKLPNLTLSTLEVDKSTAKFDLTLRLTENTAGIKAIWEYNTDLFNSGTITRMTGHFQTLLAGIVANPSQSIAQLPLLTEAELHQLLVEWNNTKTDYPQDKCIHQLFEEQVARTPDAVAVVFENQSLTYRELNNSANQLAHYLQKLGVKPEVLVGICLERSLEMIVGILGILKAGGAYVPLDPNYPKERLAHLLSDSQILVLLTQEHLVSKLPENQAQVVKLNNDWGIISKESDENPVSGVQPENLTYIIYTSGSTGLPKGVMIEHRSVLNLLTGLDQNIYTQYFNSPLRVSVNGSLSFDTSVKQLIQILKGHTLEIVPEELRFDGDRLLSYLGEHQVDVFDCTPSQLELLIRAGLLTKSKSVPKAILVGGEPINETTWQILAQAKYIHFYDVYGPTECTVDATVCDLRWFNLKPVIGRPITNTEIYILDQYLQPVPIGIPGELHIGGDGLARGYLNRPELTAEKFIPNPFKKSKVKSQKLKSDRLYKTGDLARYLPDGNIEFIGRIDNQVKIRGFRIELGEIESALNQYPDVRETVVIAREDVPGDKRLVAYVVSLQQPAPTTDKLRRFLKDKFPEYMVPSAFVVLEALPLTPNGKVDRRALPAPDNTRQESPETFIAPRDELELQLTKVWEKVLGIKPIGVKDNFFNLGGHSMLIVQLFAQIEKTFGKKLPLATIFQAPNVEELANIIRQSGWTTPWFSLVPIQPNGSKPPLFGIHYLGKGLEFYRNMIPYIGSDQPIYGLNYWLATQTKDTEAPPPNTVEELAADYIKEIRTLQPDGPYLLAGVSFGGIVAYEMAQQLHAQGQKASLLVLFDTYSPKLPIKSMDAITLQTHLRNLSQMNFKEKFAYIMMKVNYKIIEKTPRWLKHFFLKMREMFYIVSKLPMPHDLHHLLVIEANHKLAREYEIQVYPGRVTLFRAKEQAVRSDHSEDLGWTSLATGGVEIHKVPGDHLGMFQQPSVQVLAEKLKACIDKTIAETSAK